MQNESYAPAATFPNDTQFISSLERDEILRESRGPEDKLDDNDNDHVYTEDEGSEDELASPTQPRNGTDGNEALEIIITSPSRISPITPATARAGRKRDNQGNFVQPKSPVSRTPAPNLTSFFPVNQSRDTLGLSQLFQQTQAATSPFTNAPHSDPIFQRPSPDFRAPFHSSPPGALYSSPSNQEQKIDHSSAPAVEPKARYVPMEESQERRRIRAQNARRESNGPTNNSDSDEQDSLTGIGKVRKGPTRASKPRLRHQVRSEAQDDEVTPTRNSIHKGKSKRNGQSVAKPRQKTALVDSDVEASYDEDELDSPLDLVETQDQHLADEDTDVQVPMSTSRTQPDEFSDKGGADAHGQNPDEGTQSRSRLKIIQSSPANVNVEQVVSYDLDIERGIIRDSQFNSESLEQDADTAPPRSKGAVPSPTRSSSPLSSSPSSDAVSSLRPGGNSRIDKRSSNSVEDARVTQSDSQKENSNDPAVESAPYQSSDSITPLIEAQKPRLQYAVVENSSSITAMVPETSMMSPRKDTQSRFRLPQNVSEETPLYPSSRTLDHHTSTEVFATAKTELSKSIHLGKSQDSIQDIGVHQTDHQHSQSQPSPQRPAIRKLADIAGNPNTPDATQSLSIDIEILNADDRHFQQLTSSPQTSPFKGSRSVRRVKTHSTRNALGSTSRDANDLGNVEGVQGSALTATERTNDIEELRMIAPMPDESSDKAIRAAPSKTTVAVNIGRSGGKLKPVKKRKQSMTLVEQSSLATSGGAEKVSHIRERQKLLNSESHKSNNTSNTTQSSHFQPRQIEELLSTKSFSEHNAASDQRKVSHGDSSDGASKKRLYPQRVFARFMDRKLAYYPATCLGKVPTRSNVYRVRFDDETEDELDVFHVRSCELRLGDQVKVDLPSMTKHTYVVNGFPESLPLQGHDFPKTDVFGNETVLVGIRPRSSLPSTGEDQISNGGSVLVEVPITNIYFPNMLFSKFRDREYNHIDMTKSSILATGIQTPLEGPSSRAGSPPSRTRRQTTNVSLFTPDIAASFPGLARGIFSNMAFAITYTNEKETEKERARINRLILENGGRILASGFEELFDLPSSDTASPSKKVAPSSRYLSLNAIAAEMGFTALIANTHCRRTKYMQALALHIPCLSGRWIIDCMTENAILPWSRYLLAAGESSLLGGAVRSRTLSATLLSTTAASATLENLVADRPTMLRGESVIIFKDKSMTEEQIKTYIFITHALGAERVERVGDVTALKTLLSEPGSKKWSRVYVKEKKIDDVRTKVDNRSVKVVCDECIAQSLILGSLVDNL